MPRSEIKCNSTCNHCRKCLDGSVDAPLARPVVKPGEKPLWLEPNYNEVKQILDIYFPEVYHGFGSRKTQY